MYTVYLCPHCRTQNFATQKRLRLARRVPLVCWKCGQKIEKPFSREDLPGGGKAQGRKSKQLLRGKR